VSKEPSPEKELSKTTPDNRASNLDSSSRSSSLRLHLSELPRSPSQRVAQLNSPQSPQLKVPPSTPTTNRKPGEASPSQRRKTSKVEELSKPRVEDIKQVERVYSNTSAQQSLLSIDNEDSNSATTNYKAHKDTEFEIAPWNT
jgi:hypothetical protein